MFFASCTNEVIEQWLQFIAFRVRSPACDSLNWGGPESGEPVNHRSGTVRGYLPVWKELNDAGNRIILPACLKTMEMKNPRLSRCLATVGKSKAEKKGNNFVSFMGN